MPPNITIAEDKLPWLRLDVNALFPIVQAAVIEFCESNWANPRHHAQDLGDTGDYDTWVIEKPGKKIMISGRQQLTGEKYLNQQLFFVATNGQDLERTYSLKLEQVLALPSTESRAASIKERLQSLWQSI